MYIERIGINNAYKRPMDKKRIINKTMNISLRIVQFVLGKIELLFQKLFYRTAILEKDSVETLVPKIRGTEKVIYYNACNRFLGLESFYRLPKEIVSDHSSVLQMNSKCSAGKRVIFKTNAEHLLVNVIYKYRPHFSNMSINAASGIDVYEKRTETWEWKGILGPYNDVQMCVKKKIVLAQGMKDVQFYLPSYAQIASFLIGFPQGSKIVYKNEDNKVPIVFYGSSITQGCAASRPGLAYPNVVSRYYNTPILNYGISESAKGQSNILEYISAIKSSIIIVEYDHNQSLDKYKTSHLNAYKIIRKRNKKAWLIFMSRFSGGISESYQEEDKRIAIIKETMKYASSRNDRRVYFLNGKNAFEKKEMYFTDDRHPNDMGMIQIAHMLIRVIESEKIFNDK